MTSGWETWADIQAEAVREIRNDRSTPPVACPNDGEPLVVRGGKRHCPFDGWEWPTDPNPLHGNH